MFKVEQKNIPVMVQFWKSRLDFRLAVGIQRVYCAYKYPDNWRRCS